MKLIEHDDRTATLVYQIHENGGPVTLERHFSGDPGAFVMERIGQDWKPAHRNLEPEGPRLRAKGTLAETLQREYRRMVAHDKGAANPKLSIHRGRPPTLIGQTLQLHLDPHTLELAKALGQGCAAQGLGLFSLLVDNHLYQTEQARALGQRLVEQGKHPTGGGKGDLGAAQATIDDIMKTLQRIVDPAWAIQAKLELGAIAQNLGNDDPGSSSKAADTPN